MLTTAADPATEPAPLGWDDAVRAVRAGSLWSWPVLRTLAWSAPTPTVAVAVTEPAEGWSAHFHLRLLGTPTALRRFSRSVPPGCVAECRIHPNGSLPGYLFTGDSPAAWREQAIVAAGAAIGPYPRSMIAFRNVPVDDLHLFATHPVVLTTSPDLVLENRWSTVAAYADSTGKRQRSEIRRIARRLGSIADLTVRFEPTVPAVQAARLFHEVLRRNRPGWWSFPPLPAAYFEQVAKHDDASFLTYRRHDELLAVALVHDDGRDLVVSTFGQHHATPGDRPGYYFDVLHRSAVQLISTGRRRLRYGKSMTTIKRRFGATPQPTFVVLTGSGPLTGPATGRPAMPGQLLRRPA